MDNQSTIEWLDHIKTLVERGNAKAALKNINNLLYAMRQRDGQVIPNNVSYPAIFGVKQPE